MDVRVRGGRTEMRDFTGHTPGPWEFDEGNMASCYGNPYYGIITNTQYSVYIRVGANADDYRGNRGREDECIANARLVAAAPDLLAERDKPREALEELVFLIDHDRYFYDEEPTEMKRARKALQEAKDDT